MLKRRAVALECVPEYRLNKHNFVPDGSKGYCIAFAGFALFSFFIQLDSSRITEGG